MITVSTERRIDGKVKSLCIAAVACALFAAAGIAHGMHDANPAGGWLVPSLAGGVAALAFAIFWHVVIRAAIGMVRMTTICTLFAAAIFATAIALGASAQAIATAISGHSALSAELSEQVDGYNATLAEAYADATAWRSIADQAIVIATGLDSRANMESNGSHGTGKGQGPKWASLKEQAGAFSSISSSLHDLLDHAKDLQVKGERQMGLLRDAAAHGDQPGFMAAAGALSTVIDELNAVDPRPIITSAGVVSTSAKGIDLSKETSEFQDKAQKAIAERKTVSVPTFRPLSLGEATRRQVLGSASHGWILAGAIDVLPLVFLIIAFTLSREVWMNEKVTHETLTPEGRDEVDRQKVASLMGRSIRVAAE
jgi:hypothetical protein